MKHSEETKKKLSVKRKEYLKKIGKNAWENKTSSQSSVPCEKLKEILRLNNIEFIEEYMPLYEDGRYFRLDILISSLGLGIEVNGRQHYDSEGCLLPYYQERHNFIVAKGWQLIEIPYDLIFRKGFLEEFITDIKNKTVNQNKIPQISHRQEPLYNKTKEEIQVLVDTLPLYRIAKDYHVHTRSIKKLCKSLGIVLTNTHFSLGIAREHKRKVERPSKTDLEKIIWEKPFTVLSKIYGVSDNAIRKWCKFYGITNFPGQGYFLKKKAAHAQN